MDAHSVMPLLKVSNLSKSFKDAEKLNIVLDEVSFDIDEGEFCVISGPSGSGKSTLLNILGTLDVPDRGEILLHGRDIVKLKEDEKAKFRNRTIGFVFQSFHLMPVLTAAENVAWPLYFQNVPNHERMERAREALRIVELSDKANARPHKLSGGQKQRVAIARALVTRPDIIFADEPTANLDRQTAQEILNWLEELNKSDGTTLIVASHDPLIIERDVSRIEFLGDGSILKTAKGMA